MVRSTGFRGSASEVNVTVTLALGSPEGITKANTTVTFTSDADPLNPVDLTNDVVSIFRAYPDKRSLAAIDSAATQIPNDMGHEAWLTVMALNLPATLPEGPGTIQVSTSATYPATTTAVNDVVINIEILPGVGQPNPLRYMHNVELVGDLTDLEPLPRVELRTTYDPANPELSWPLFGAVDITWTVPMQTDLGGAVTDSDIRVITEDMSGVTKSQLQTLWSRNGDQFRILLVSTTGMQSYEPRITAVLRQGNQFVGDPSATPTVTFYDLNGNPITGPEVTVWKDGVQVQPPLLD